MKQKLFTLLTLLLCAVSTMWASTVDDLAVISKDHNVYFEDKVTAKVNEGTLFDNSCLLSLAGGNNYATNKGTDATISKLYCLRVKSSTQDVLAFKVNSACTLTLYADRVKDRTPILNTSISTTNGITGEVTATDGNKGYATYIIPSAGTYYIIGNGSDCFLAGLEFSFAAITAPIITASNATITATESGVEATYGITVTGANLTGSTLTATLNPLVPGLSVTLDETTITAGAITTKATLHYTATKNASGSTTLTLSDGTTNKDVTITYKAHVAATELEAISEAITFDLSKVGTSGMGAITLDDGYVVLSDAGSDVSFADNIAVSCIPNVGVTWRNDAVQAPLFKFKTDVPGNVTLKFSDVGSSSGRAHRYAAVNDVLTNVYSTTSASSGVVTCSPISVEAGEVIIKGQVEGENNTYMHNQIRVFEIVFTPNKAVTITDAGWATLYTPDALDFAKAKPAGLKAYTATLNDNIVTLTKVDNVPAQTGVVLKGAANTYSIPVITNSTNDEKGSMVGSTTDTNLEANTAYILGINGTTGKAQFFINSEGTIEAGKAYLPAGNTNEAKALSVVFADDLTGITNANAAEEIAQPAKRIVNGQLVIEKNGKRYNAAGAEF